MSNILDYFVIYHNALDYPGKFVVRRHRQDLDKVRSGFTQSLDEAIASSTVPDPKPLTVVDSLDEARDALPPGLTNIGRYDNDDAVIVEVWV